MFVHMAKSQREEAPWLKKLGIDQTCRLVAMCRGMITLTTDPDGWHTLWIYSHPVMTGDATTMRNRYADYLALDPGGEWLVKFYRS